jgi:Tfp pilus assembly protein PilO
MALNKRERVLLGTIITSTVLVGNYLLLTKLASRWQTLRSQLIISRKEWNSVEATVQLAPGWQKEYKQLRESLGQQSGTFQQTSDVLNKLEDLRNSSGIVIKERKPMQPVERDVYRELPVQCTFDSTTETLVKFLFGLQTSSGFMRVEDLQVTPQPDNPSVLRCSVRLQALTGKSGSPKS